MERKNSAKNQCFSGGKERKERVRLVILVLIRKYLIKAVKSLKIKIAFTTNKISYVFLCNTKTPITIGWKIKTFVTMLVNLLGTLDILIT